MEQLIVATRNPGKLVEIKFLLQGISLSIRGLDEFPLLDQAVENGDTYAQNALLKAEAIFLSTGIPTIADDSGLEVDALHGAPGIYSARYAGPDATDETRIQRLLDELKGVGTARSARFMCAAVLIGNFPSFSLELVKKETKGICQGRIATAPTGSGGFGYDPIFIPDGFSKSMAELLPKTKNRISHRGKAFRQMAEFLIKL
jgi:XTP/dITP diphosphohydrolase